MGTYIKALLLIALLFLAITFGTQNSDLVTLRYYFGLLSIPIPLYLVIYVAIILGIIAGMVIGISTRASLKGKLKKLEKANASLREELDKMESQVEKEVEAQPEGGPTEAGIDKTKTLPSQDVQPNSEKTADGESMTSVADRDQPTEETTTSS